MARDKSKPAGPSAALRRSFGEHAVRPGKQGMLGRDRSHVEVATGARIECSLDLDGHFKTREPNAPRWDYVLVVSGTAERGVAVEVHPATAGEVDAVLRKREWAKRTLEGHCPSAGIGPSDWYWIASGKVFLRATDPQFRRLRQSGLQGPIERLVLRP
jgi:hypothetical protein